MKTLNPKIQSVLITGTSSGIGFATAVYLDSIGMKVYAGVRREEDGEKLIQSGTNNITPVILDVCDRNTVQNSYELLRKQAPEGKFSLINNAGLSLNGPLELMNLDEIHKLINVNVTGLMSVTKTFLPLIRLSKGRIINISSGHGLVAVPDKSVYAASKFAVQALSDSLRVELMPFGVKVSNIVVGKIDTNVLGKIMDERQMMMENAQPEILALYRRQIDYFDREVKNLPSMPAEQAAALISHALTDVKPKFQYLVGPGAKRMKTLSKFSPKMRSQMLYKAIFK